MAAQQSALDAVRAICTALPAVSERLSHGEPAWFAANGKMFAMFADRHHDDVVGLWCAAPDGVQADLVDEEPERFYRPPYVGHRGWLGVRLDRGIDTTELTRIVGDAHRVVGGR